MQNATRLDQLGARYRGIQTTRQGFTFRQTSNALFERQYRDPVLNICSRFHEAKITAGMVLVKSVRSNTWELLDANIITPPNNTTRTSSTYRTTSTSRLSITKVVSL